MILDQTAHPSGLLSWTGSSHRKWTKPRGPVTIQYDSINRLQEVHASGGALLATYTYGRVPSLL